MAKNYLNYLAWAAPIWCALTCECHAMFCFRCGTFGGISWGGDGAVRCTLLLAHDIL